jgi:hypothetical protein
MIHVHIRWFGGVERESVCESKRILVARRWGVGEILVFPKHWGSCQIAGWKIGRRVPGALRKSSKVTMDTVFYSEWGLRHVGSRVMM